MVTNPPVMTSVTSDEDVANTVSTLRATDNTASNVAVVPSAAVFDGGVIDNVATSTSAMTKSRVVV